jgi:hypothetical protein
MLIVSSKKQYRTVALAHDYHRHHRPEEATTRYPLNQFRTHTHECMTRRGDALFELADAIAASPTRISDIARLSVEPEQERGHGPVYDGLAIGNINHDLLAQTLAATPIPTITGPDGRGRIVLAVDVSTGCAQMQRRALTGRSVIPTPVGKVAPT